MKKVLSLLFVVVLLTGSFGCNINSSDDLRGSVLYLSGNEPYTLDPAVAGDANSNIYISQIFSGLVRLDKDLAPVPDIAEDWQVSGDGHTYTFCLRHDAYFHNGKQVTAEDFVYSWNRAADPDTGSTTVGTYLGDIVGVAEVMAGEAETISGVKVIDDFTLEVTIDEPRSYFLMKMTFVTSYVVDRENVEQASDWWRQPQGTGPFKLDRFGDDKIVLEKNDDYYLGAPLVDYVSFDISSFSPIDLYERGEIDVCPVDTSYIDRVRDESGSYYEDLTVYPELSFYYIAFNCEEPPFDDPDIRRAFAMALDRDKMVSLIHLDTVEPAEGILPTGMPGYNEDINGIPFDVEAAKELIAQSSYGSVENLPPITITTGGYGGNIGNEHESMVYQWRENLGVEATVRQIDPDSYAYNLKEEKDQIFMFGWIADYPHPQNFLEVLFGTGSDANLSGYSNSQVDFLLQAAAASGSNSQSTAFYQQAEQLLIDDTACIPFWFGENYVLVRSYVGGYYQNALGMPVLTDVVVLPH